jgi:hypothetical protein
MNARFSYQGYLVTITVVLASAVVGLLANAGTNVQAYF